MTKEFQSTNYEVNLRTPNDKLPTAFMQNKPNFSNNSMNINPFTTKYYERKLPLRRPAKQTQFKPNQTQFLPRTFLPAAAVRLSLQNRLKGK